MPAYDTEPQRVIDRALALAAKKGWNQSEFGKQLGVGAANITNWKARDLPADMYQRVATALGCSLDELVRGAGVLIAAESGTAESSFNAIRAWHHPEDLPAGEYVFIPRLHMKLSAGHGREQLQMSFNEGQPQAFRADWIRRERLKPNKLAAMDATGDSMEPSIWDGDSVVIDTSQTEVIDGKVYALWYEGGERVKRLFRLPGGGLRIQSDNPAYPPIILDNEHIGHVRVLGRVVHRSGKGGL